MIAVVIKADTVGPPVVTTPETINERVVEAVMTPVVAKLMSVVESITGVFPVQMKLEIIWADGTDEGISKPKVDEPYTNPGVPKWMS